MYKEMPQCYFCISHSYVKLVFGSQICLRLTFIDDEIAYAEKEKEWLPSSQSIQQEWSPQPGSKLQSLPEGFLLHLWREHGTEMERQLHRVQLKMQQVFQPVVQATILRLYRLCSRQPQKPIDLSSLHAYLDRLLKPRAQLKTPYNDMVSRTIPQKVGEKLVAKLGKSEVGWGLVLKEGFRPPSYVRWPIRIAMVLSMLAIPILWIYGEVKHPHAASDTLVPVGVVVALATLLLNISKNLPDI